MGKNKNKKEKNNGTMVKVLTPPTTETLEDTAKEIRLATNQYTLFATEFKAYANRIKWKENEMILERGKLIQERDDAVSLALDFGLIEESLSGAHGRVIIRETKRISTEALLGKEFESMFSRVEALLGQVNFLQQRLGGYYLNELVLLYVKCLVLKCRFLELENAAPEALTMLMETTYLMYILPLKKRDLKYKHDEVFQHEVAYLIRMLEERITSYDTALSSDQRLLDIALDNCRFADGCESPALRLRMYFGTLCRPNGDGKLMMLHPDAAIPVTDLYQLYEAVKKRFFDLMAKKEVDAKAILEFVDASFMLFIYKNTVAKSSLFRKNRHQQLNSLDIFKNGLPTDEEFRAHLEMTKKLRSEYLESALRVLLRADLSVVFADMEVCEDMKKMFTVYRSHLFVNTISKYQAFLKMRNIADNLSADTEFEILQFERLAQILLDCFQYLEEFRINDSNISKSDKPYREIKQKINAIKQSKADDFLRRESEANAHKKALEQWEKKQNEYLDAQRKRQEEVKVKEKEQQEKAKAAARKKATEAKDTRGGVSAQRATHQHEAALPPAPFEIQFNKFIHSAGSYLAHAHYAQAITAYEVALQIATRANDAYKRICAIDGMIIALGFEVMQSLYYINTELTYRLDSQKVMSPKQNKAIRDLITGAVTEFNKVKKLYLEYEAMAMNTTLAANTDFLQGRDDGKRAIEELLSNTEGLINDAEEMHAQLESEALQQHENYIFRKGLAVWRAQGKAGVYDEDYIWHLGKQQHRSDCAEQVKEYMKKHGPAANPEEAFHHYSEERKLLKEMAPLIEELRSVTATIRPSVAKIALTGRVIMFTPNVWHAFNRVAEMGGTQLLTGCHVLKLMRGWSMPQMALPDDAVLIGEGTEGECATRYAQQQFFTITSVCANRAQRLIDTCQMGIDDILFSRLRLLAPNPLEQIYHTPESLVLAAGYIRLGFVPVESLQKAMLEWQPDENYRQQHSKRVLTVFKQQVSLLSESERLGLVKILIEYKLTKKLFNIDHSKRKSVLWLIEDQWKPKLSVAKFHLLARTPIKPDSRDDTSLTPLPKRSISCLR